MSEYRAVVFDLFGTLTPDMLESDRLRLLGEMAAIVGADVDPYLEVWETEEAAHARLSGRVTMREEILRVTGALRLAPSEAQIEEALAWRRRWLEGYFAFPASVVETIKLLRHHGLAIGLISACTEEVPHLWADSSLAPYFDAAVFSYEVGVMKPEPEIYRLALDALEVAPRDAIYIADGAFGELHGAQEAGMTAALIARQGTEGAHLPGWRDWDGERIGSLPEVMRLVC